MPHLAPTTRVVARPDVLSCPVGTDGAVLLDPRGGTYLGVEDVASLIWTRLVAGPVTLHDLCASVVEAYDVSDTDCDADVRAFLDDLLRRDLVSIVQGADAGDHGA